MIGNVVGIDLGTKLGWALADDGGVRQAQMRDLGMRAPTGDLEMRHACIFSRASGFFADLLQQHQPNAVVYEVPNRNLKGDAARIHLGLRACLLGICHIREVLVDPVAPPSWQAWAKRQGRTEADKSDANDAAWLLRFWFATRAGLVVREAA